MWVKWGIISSALIYQFFGSVNEIWLFMGYWQFCVSENGTHYLMSYHVDLMNVIKLRECDEMQL
jgi:hypothetical protein